MSTFKRKVKRKANSMVYLWFLASVVACSSGKKMPDSVVFACPFENGQVLINDVNKVTERKVINPSNVIEVTGKDNHVLSVADGTVTKTLVMHNKTYIYIQSGDYLIIYGQLDSATVQINSPVKKGDAIGMALSNKISLKINKGMADVSNPEKYLRCK